MTNITINYKKNTIEITKSFEKKASAYGSDEYKELMEARKEFPNYRLVIKTTKSNNSFKGMDYDFMKEYISKHDDAEKLMEGFERLRANNKEGFNLALSPKAIHQEVGFPETTCRDQIKVLIDKGYLVPQQEGSNVYHFYETPKGKEKTGDV